MKNLSKDLNLLFFVLPQQEIGFDEFVEIPIKALSTIANFSICSQFFNRLVRMEHIRPGLNSPGNI